MQQRQKHKGGIWAKVAVLGKQHGIYTEQINVCLVICMQGALPPSCV